MNTITVNAKFNNHNTNLYFWQSSKTDYPYEVQSFDRHISLSCYRQNSLSSRSV